MANYSLSLGTTLNKEKFKLTNSWINLNSVLTAEYSILLSYLQSHQQANNNQLSLEITVLKSILKDLDLQGSLNLEPFQSENGLYLLGGQFSLSDKITCHLNLYYQQDIYLSLTLLKSNIFNNFNLKLTKTYNLNKNNKTDQLDLTYLGNNQLIPTCKVQRNNTAEGTVINPSLTVKSTPELKELPINLYLTIN
ncbi:hypothetical protein MWH28_00535 [Natroniella sulfidigena]|uniref:hypothetical protein n=1 Tax=Natroniella sulfidigena TaxID=723921 RepID=UPI00200A0F22|nr:hypothetical protein [Natroniella sulfidigena]MCK8815850.1 hypothetical protein [Natroniella sulfidigena]